jgi:hypothetical protein
VGYAKLAPKMLRLTDLKWSMSYEVLQASWISERCRDYVSGRLIAACSRGTPGRIQIGDCAPDQRSH